MGNNVSLSSMTLKGKVQTGVLERDSEGYVTMPVGALNVFNSAGQFYTSRGVDALFNSSSELQDRISRRALVGEQGHPSPLNLTNSEYLARLHTIDDSNICVYFDKVYLDYEHWKKVPRLNKDVIVIMARLKGYGPHAKSVDDAIDDPNQNLSFSIRGLSKDVQVNGITVRTLVKIFTFDKVYLPGIDIASKFNSGAIESIEVTPDINFSKEDADGAIKSLELSGAAVENINDMNNTISLFDNMKNTVSPWTGW